MKFNKKINKFLILVIVVSFLLLSFVYGSSEDSFNLYIMTFTKDDILPEVMCSYEKQINGTLDFIVTNNKGVFNISLDKGSYVFNCYKDDYNNEKKTIVLNSDLFLNITLDKRNSFESDIINPKEQKFGITLNYPLSDYYDSKEINLDYKIEEYNNKICDLLISSEGDYGWIKIDSQKTFGKDNIFYLNNLKGGVYDAKIRCLDSNNNYDFSNTISIKIKDNSKDANLFLEYKQNVEDVKKQIDSLDLKIKNIIVDFGIVDKINKQLESINLLEIEYNNISIQNISFKEKKEKENKILSDLLELNKRIINNVYIEEIHERIVYLPNSGYDELYDSYNDLSIEDSSLLKFSYRELMILQNDITLTQKIIHFVLDYNSGDSERMTLIEKSFIKSLDNLQNSAYSYPSKGILFLEVIPYSIANFDEIIFISEYEKKGKDSYFLKTGNLGTINYVIKKKISNEQAKHFESLIIPKKELSAAESLSKITGKAIDGSNNKSSGIGIYIIFLIMVLVLGVVFLPGMPMNKVIQKNPEKELKKFLNSTINYIEKNGVPSSIFLFTRVLELYEKVPEEKKENYSHMINILCNYLEQEAIKKDIKELNKKIGFQRMINNYDDALMNQIETMYKDIILRYESLPENYKIILKEETEKVDYDYKDIRKRFFL
jgi:hypothetical protein